MCSDSGVAGTVGFNASLNNVAREGAQGRQIFKELVSLTWVESCSADFGSTVEKNSTRDVGRSLGPTACGDGGTARVAGSFSWGCTCQ